MTLEPDQKIDAMTGGEAGEPLRFVLGGPDKKAVGGAGVERPVAAAGDDVGEEVQSLVPRSVLDPRLRGDERKSNGFNEHDLLLAELHLEGPELGQELIILVETVFGNQLVVNPDGVTRHVA